MSVYSGAVFLHVVGALGLFASIGVEQASLGSLRRAHSNAQVREWVAVLGGLRRVDAPSGILILVTGFYMMATRWGQQAWIGLALLGIVAMVVIGIAGTGRRVNAIRKSVPVVDGPVSAALRDRLNDRVLLVAASLRAAIGLGIVFNMTVKPNAVGALTAMGVAVVVGAVAALVRSPSSGRVVPVDHNEARV